MNLISQHYLNHVSCVYLKHELITYIHYTLGPFSFQIMMNEGAAHNQSGVPERTILY